MKIKKIIIFVLILSQIQSLLAIDSALLADKIEVGPGISGRRSVYLNQGATAALVPIVIINYGNFYSEGDKAAYILSDASLGEITFWTEAIALYRQQGFLDAKLALSGLNDRRNAVELGGAVGIAHENFGIVNLSIAYDVINTHKGYELALKYEAPLVFGDIIIRPVLSIQSMSINLANYYFAVNHNEVIAGRPAYFIDKATNYSIGYDLKYLLDDKWRLTHSVELTRFDSTIYNSPIVDFRTNIQISAAIVYDFF